MSDIIDDLSRLIRTQHAFVSITTFDEDFAVRQIRKAARTLSLPVYEWSITTGLRRSVPSPQQGPEGSNNLQALIGGLRQREEIAVYILKDALGLVTQPETRRMLRELAFEFVRDFRTVFLVDHAGSLPDGLQGLALPYDIPLPDADEIMAIVRKTYRDLSRFSKMEVNLSNAQFERFRSNMLGLSRGEIAQVTAAAFLDDDRLDESDLDAVLQAKRARLSKTGVLDYIPAPASRPKIGGMARLRHWLEQRGLAVTRDIQRARDYGLQPPKGILMLGVQGCGKSLMAKYVAADWGLPLLRMDVGALYDKYVGESERHLRQAFSIAAAMAPCVLWIDEIEKAFASAGAGSAGAASDGGLSQRMFGQLLSWMQDRDEPVFIVATANDISALPPEMMRKGRFDEIFFIDLPGEQARRQIVEIHLERRRRNAGDFDLRALAAACEGFSGSEIEQAIVSAMYTAFNAQREVNTEDILAEIAQTRPLSVVMAEKVAELRRWASQRCVLAE